MNQRIVLLLCLAAGWLCVGCGNATIEVDRTDATELQLVSEYLARQTDYQHYLSVVETFYKRTGNLDKLRWARKEIKNLRGATEQARFDLQPEIAPPQGESMVDRDQRILVENLVESRGQWLAAQQDLAAFYKQSGQSEKLAKLNEIRQAFRDVYTYMYFLDAEIPGPGLRPTVVHAEAEDLYAEAMALKDGLLAGRADKAKALSKLLRLVEKYPDSTKIALAAYHIAEIYKDEFDENIRAVNWYQRAWQWDPEIDQPARFQAALVYDLRLHNVPKAIETYRLARKYDPYRLGNDDFARARVAELTAPKE